MKLSSAASLLLGLLFSIIIVLFVVVSILLIYSLLMISVETKTFETGVLRLLGLTKYDCIQMILIQSFFYVVAAIILAYLASIPSLYGIFAAMFAKQPEIQVAPIPSAGATVKAVILGLTIPVISAIIPIYKALQK